MKAGSLFAVILSAIVLTVSGCTARDQSENPIANDLTDDAVQSADEFLPDGTTAAEEETSAEETGEPALIPHAVSCDFGVTDLSGKSDIKEELLSHILEYQSMSKEDAEQKSRSDEDFAAYYSQAYTDNQIGEITEFYYPDLTIDGFTLYSASIDEQYFSYRFAPNEKLGIGSESQLGFGDVILIAIARTHWIDPEHPLDSLIQQYNNTHVDYILDSDLLYGKGKQSINGIIGNTRFKLYGPKGANDYESLVSLAQTVIDSMVLVQLESGTPA